ncbi:MULTISPECIES: cupin domain-containing protein [unclassified Synechococcus]|uniref:cupin domain-containing protein n=1 Tax=unclassified Synechococcus TaxID=2626047 RepID=UPI0020CCEA87|nr:MULTISPECIES: cupin domain-containing protein [unclassified Synechococcus]
MGVLTDGRVLALVCGLGLLAQASPARTDEVIGRPGDGGIITVRPAKQHDSRQGLGRFVGISGANSGARTLSLNRIVIPAGAKARAHRHRNYETAIYLLQGMVETRYGAGLLQRVVNRAGDFIFIPADLPHQPVNLSATEPAIAIVTRSDPNEQESVELLDDAGQPLPAHHQHGPAHP